MRKLNCILLIDDSDATNQYNKEMLEMMNLATHIEIKENGKDALDYIMSNNSNVKENVTYPHPELILLDIDMPIMNGFEFLEEHNKLDAKYKSEAGVIIAMLTQNFSIDTYHKSKDEFKVKDFINKPLDVDDLDSIWDEFF